MKFKQVDVGIVVDFNNYKDYFNRFNKKYGCKVIEFHILENDLKDNFSNKIKEIKNFILRKNIKNISFHSPDRIVQSALFEEKCPDLEENKAKFYMLTDELKRLSLDMDREIILVVHQGFKVDKKELDNMSENDIDRFRLDMLTKARKSYDQLIDYVKDSKLLIMLENSPPSCANDSSEHFIDLAFEDLVDRIGNHGFVFDFSHAAMCIEYFKQDKIKFAALEALRRSFNGIPESLLSMEDYIKKAGKNIKWMHINDANGILGENEGLVVGVEDGLIDFKKIIEAIKKYVVDPKGILEIVDSHKDYGLIEYSMENLNKK